MRPTFGFVVLIAALLLIASSALATVVEVDVTIKSVDAKSRGITVTYETKSGQKSIDLDVSRKAEITINGEAGSLGQLRPGQKAKVVYEKDLQVVTKIEATGQGTPPGKEVYRLTLQLSEFGDGKFRIEKTSQPPADDFNGTPYKLSRWPKTKAKKGKDGLFQLVHDFSDADDLGLLAFDKHNLSIDKDSGLLVFTPGPLPENFSMRPGANWFYAKKLRLPMTVMYDVVKHGGEHFALHVSGQAGMLQCRFWTRDSNLDNPFNVVVDWHEYGEGGKRTTTTLCDVKAVTLEEPTEKHFRLPLPNVKISDLFTFDLSRAIGNEPTTISRLEVRGRLAPMFGLGMGEKQGVVFAHNIFPKGLADKAGLQVGDVIVAINGTKPKKMLEAVDILGHVSIGDEVVFTVQRADKTKELRVVAE
jgi:hypothetical protein